MRRQSLGVLLSDCSPETGSVFFVLTRLHDRVPGSPSRISHSHKHTHTDTLTNTCIGTDTSALVVPFTGQFSRHSVTGS